MIIRLNAALYEILRALSHFQESTSKIKLPGKPWQKVPPVEWVPPRRVGARNHSYHTKQLTSLVKKGLVERKSRNPRGTRQSFLYRLAPRGRIAMDNYAAENKRYGKRLPTRYVSDELVAGWN